MIQNFADPSAADVFHGQNTKAARQLPQDAHKSIRKALNILNGAASLAALAQVPGLRLEKRQDYPGFYSIRATLIVRVFFRFEGGHAYDVFVKNDHGLKTS